MKKAHGKPLFKDWYGYKSKVEELLKKSSIYM